VERGGDTGAPPQPVEPPPVEPAVDLATNLTEQAEFMPERVHGRAQIVALERAEGPDLVADEAAGQAERPREGPEPGPPRPQDPRDPVAGQVVRVVLRPGGLVEPGLRHEQDLVARGRRVARAGHEPAVQADDLARVAPGADP